MTLTELARFIEAAIERKPTKAISKICGEYYQPYYQLMFFLAKQANGRMVELGVEKGRGLACLASGNGDYIVLGLDNDPREEVDEIISRFDNVVFLEASSLPAPPFIDSPSISMLHIDTEHSYSMAKAEFEAYSEYLLPGAVVLFDDLHAQEDGVLRYFSELPHPKIQDDRLHPECGYGVLLYV